MLGMRLEMRHQLRQELKQKLELKLRLELRLALKQLLKLIHALLLKQVLTLEDAVEFRNAWRGMGWADRSDFARIAARNWDVGLGARDVMFALARFDRKEFGELAEAATGIDQNIRRLREQGALRMINEAARHENKDLRLLALRFILRLPPPGRLFWSAEDLVKLLSSALQYDGDGELVWILAGGWAVELLLGEAIREHHDIDTIALGEHPMLLDTDKQHPDNYFDIFECTSEFLVAKCVRKVKWHGANVFVLAPEFLFLSKFIRPPRPQDWQDAQALIRKFAERWDLRLICEIIGCNICRFGRTAELMTILGAREPEYIIEALGRFW